MDKLAEFISDEKNGRLDKALAIIESSGGGPLRVSEIEEAGKSSGLREIARWNVSQILKRSKGAVVLLPEGWRITEAGRKQLESVGWATSRSHDINLIDDLNKAIAQIRNDERRSFVREAVNCYAVEHYRAAVVLSWSGAVAVMHDYVIEKSLASFNQEARRQGIVKKDIERASDLQDVRDFHFLQVLGSIGLLDKNQRQELDARRQLRNACGHPSALRVSGRMVSAHLESLVLNVFDRFQ